MTSERFNPGARLFNTMEWAHAFAHGPRLNEPPAKVWAEYFELRWPEDFGAVMRAGADLVDLTARVRREVESLEGQENVPMLLRRFGETEDVMASWPSVASISNMANFMAPLSDAGLDRLEFIADRLGVHLPEREIPQDTLRHLRNRVRHMSDLVTDAKDLDPELSKWLLERLWDLDRQIGLYKLTGSEGISRSLDETAGGLARRRGWLARLGRSDIAQGLLFLIAALDFALQSSVAVKELTAAPEPSPVVKVILEGVDPDHRIQLPSNFEDVIDAEIVEGDEEEGA